MFLIQRLRTLFHVLFQRLSQPFSLSEHDAHQDLQNVLIVTEFFPPDFAATGQLIEELSQNLNQLGLSIHVFTGQPGYAFQKDQAAAQETVAGVHVRRSRVSRIWPHRIRGKAINSLLFCLRASVYLIREARHHDILLFTTAPPYLSVIGTLIHRLTGVPYVCLIYDLYPDVAVELSVISRHHIVVQLWNYLNGWIWQRSRHIVVLSSTMKERVLSHCPGVSDRISIIHNWADPDWIQPLLKQDNWFIQEHQIPGLFTVLYSGNLGRCHDTDTILETLESLRHDPVQFVFIGGGAQRTWLMNQIQKRQLSNCRFLPYQDRHTLPFSLTAGDLTLVSLRAGMEGLIAPSKVYSGLAAGCPLAVICDAQSYLVELVSQACCGITVRHGESTQLAGFIRYLLQHPDQAARMGQAGRHYLLQNFTPMAIAQQYKAVLEGEPAKAEALPPLSDWTERPTTGQASVMLPDLSSQRHISPSDLPRH